MRSILKTSHKPLIEDIFNFKISNRISYKDLNVMPYFQYQLHSILKTGPYYYQLVHIDPYYYVNELNSSELKIVKLHVEYLKLKYG